MKYISIYYSISVFHAVTNFSLQPYTHRKLLWGKERVGGGASRTRNVLAQKMAQQM